MRRSVGSCRHPGAWGGLLGGLRERGEIYLRTAPPPEGDWQRMNETLGREDEGLGSGLLHVFLEEGLIEHQHTEPLLKSFCSTLSCSLQDLLPVYCPSCEIVHAVNLCSKRGFAAE